MDNYEEKYKSALKWMQSLYGGLHGATKEEAEKYFPELKESEDEVHRNWVLEYLFDGLRKADEQFKPQFESAITWLEKLGIQTTDKVEPKFKVGDWLQYRYAEPFLVEEITEQGYCNGNSCLPFEWEDEIHLWAIQDAKDGDVLVCNEEILLFKSYSIQGRISLYCWYNGQTNNFHSKEVDDTSLTTRNKIYPATKEQRDTLIKAMANAGHTFDFEKKELKKIKPKKLDPDKVIEWIDEHVPTKFEDMENYVQQFKKDFGL